MTKPPQPIDEAEWRELKSSYVLHVLKRRIYYGKEHATRLEDLKTASQEILDWVDDVIETGIKSHTNQAITERTWWVTNHDTNTRIAGPFTTQSDAGECRHQIEKRESHNNYWLEQITDELTKLEKSE